LVKRDADVLALSVDDGELGPDRFPGKREDVLLDLDAVDGDLLLFHVKDLEVVEDPLEIIRQHYHKLIELNIKWKALKSTDYKSENRENKEIKM
jgi:hypothetical protein